MATQFDAVARISVDLRAFSRASQQMTREGGTMDQVFRNLHGTLSRIEIVEKNLASELSRSLRVYNQISQAARNYAQAVSSLGRNSENVSRGTQMMSRAFEQLARSLSQVQGLSEREYQRLSRTLTLYTQMAQALNTLARAQQAMANTTQQSQRLEQAAARERQRAAEAAQRQALAEQRLAVTRQQAATAARNAATAELNAQARLLNVQRQVAEARRRDEAAAQRSIATNRLARNGLEDLVNSTFSLRSALGDVEGLYQGLSNTLLGIGAAATSAAISHEAAFAQIERVTQLAGAPLAEMKQSFEELAVTLPVSFEELARVAQLASQTGVANDQLLAFSDTVVRFSVITGVASDQVTLMLARIMEMRDLPVQQVGNLASAILDLGISSASTEDEILKVTESIATVTDIFGLSIEATAGLASALATLRVRPELSRGSLTRVFAQLNAAVADTGGSMATLQTVMGGTEESLQNLLDTDPDTFFLRFIEGMSSTVTEGGELRRVLADLGVNAVRDIDTISRLANNYDLLAEQVQRARVEFLLGNRLQEQSSTVFETTRVTIENLRDAFQNFLAQAGTPFAQALGSVASAATSVLEILTQFPAVTASLGILATVVGGAAVAWVGYRIAVAAAFRGVLALQQAQTQLRGSSLTLSGALREYSRLQEASALASQRQAAAATQAAAAQAAAARGITTFNNAAIAQSGYVSTVVSGMRNMATSSDQLQRNFAASTANIAAHNRVLSSTSSISASAARSAQNLNSASGAYAATAVRVHNVQRGLSDAYQASSTAAASSASAVAANTAATTANAAATTRASRAATGMANVLTWMGGHWLSVLSTITLVGAGVAALATTFRDSGNAMREASQSALQAVGGLEAYEEALVRDTQAAMEARGGIEGIQRALADSGQAATEAGRVYRVLEVANRDLESATSARVEADLRAVEAQQRAIETAHGGYEALERRAQGQGALAEAARSTLNDLEALAAQEVNYRQALEGTNIALGENARALAEQQFQTSLIESGLVDTQEAYESLSNAIAVTGFNFEDIFGEDAPQSLSEIESAIESIDDAISLMGSDSRVAQEDAEALIASLEEMGFTFDESTEGIRGARDSLELLKAVIEDNRDAFDEASRSASILSQLGLDPLGDSTQEATEQAEAAAAAMEEYQARIDELAQSYQQMIDPARAWAGENEEAIRSVEAFTERLREQVQAQQEFAQNLAALQAQGFEALVEQLRAAGPEGAEAAAELVDATRAELEELDTIARQAGEGYTSALAATMDRVGQLDIGGRAARNIGNSIVEELNRVSASGGNLEAATERIIEILDLIDQQEIQPSVAIDVLEAQDDLLQLRDVIQQAEESGDLDAEGLASLNTLLFEESISRLRGRVQSLEERRDLDPDAEAHLSEEEYQAALERLRASAAVTILQGLIDVEGDASLSTEQYEEALEILEQLAVRTTNEGGLNTQGEASLLSQEFLDEIDRLSRETDRRMGRGDFDVTGAAHLETGNFLNEQLPRVQRAAWTAGSEIQRALTRTATVSVVYSNVNSPPPPVMRVASGGWINGPGGPRDDKIPAMLSNGEFVVNAAAAKKYGKLLEAINSPHKKPSIVKMDKSSLLKMRDGGDVPRRVNSVPPGSRMRQVASTQRLEAGPVFNIHNTYPRAEPTSTTVNRALAFAATISGV